MSSQQTVIRNAVDTWANVNAASRNYGDAKSLALDSGEALAFIHFNRPFPLASTIVSATLRVYTKGSWGITPTLTAKRTDAAWKASKLTWNDKPGIVGVASTVSHSSAVDGDEFAFDVTAIMQVVSDGGAWYGFRIETSSTATKYLYSADSVVYRPSLDITWSEAPQAPSTLSPSGNRCVSIAKPVLRFDFTDEVGSTALAAVNVQIDAANNFVSGIDFDSGTVSATEPELDLSTTAYAGITLASSTYWRVRVQDGAGLWSAWSDPAQMRRDAKGTLTITNPAVSPNNFVTEWTPPILWTLTSETQTSYQILVTETDDRTVVAYDSGRLKGTATSLTLPKAKIVDGRSYGLIVRIWDSKDRESTPGDRAYTEATRDFTFNEDATVTTVSALTVTQIPSTPWVNVNFTRATAPDSFNLVRDSEVVDSGILPGDVLVSGTTYKIVDRDAAPNKSHIWKVQAVVGGKSSASNPTFTFTAAPEGVWIYDKDRNVDLYVSATSAGTTFDTMHEGSTYYPIGSSKPVRFTQSVGGLRGVIVGVLREGGTKTAAYWIAQAESIRNRPGSVVTLSYGNEAYPVVFGKIDITQFAENATDKNFVAEFWQVGKLPAIRL